MKKILSLALAGVMMFSALPMAYAADVNYDQGTAVEYIANDEANEKWTVTVPAKLAPGGSGDVTASGTWASDRQLVVGLTANTVTLTNQTNGTDTKNLDLTFEGITLAGDNTKAVSMTKAVSVAEMPADALFGTWKGTFTYTVEMQDVA